ncbi:hypothetical protein EAE96_010869 [Botrytis aclada]|nr:hypothetical protein EAE96_010869 [Botrytis aclada]
MAILNTSQGEVEVRIKRYPEDTYYDEHIKVEGKERKTDTERERYIIAEPGTTYYMEIILKKGFKIGKYSTIDARVYLPDREEHMSSIILLSKHFDGSKEKAETDLIRKMQYVDVEIDGQKMLGARFAFKKIEIDEGLSKETDIMGIEPNHIMTFIVKLFLWESFTTRLSESEYDKALSDWEKACAEIRIPSWNQTKRNAELEFNAKTNQRDTKNIWDVKKIDEDSYKKHGIRSAIGFVGGKMRPKVPRSEMPVNSILASDPITFPKRPGRTITTYSHAPTSVIFTFHGRTAEFLEQVGIIKYPPPLHCYSWAVLNENERKTALGELQELSKKQWHGDREKECGLVLPMIRSRIKAEEHPWEWRNWDKLYAAEKQKAFESLQKAKKDRERGIVQREYKNIMGEIISLDEGDGQASKNPLERGRDDIKEDRAKIGKEGVRVKLEEIQRAMANSLDAQQATSANVINQGTINDDKNAGSIAIVSETQNPILSPAPKEEEITLADEELRKQEETALAEEELRKKESALDRLKEDIAQEERVMKMKRERDALQEKVDAARSGKRVKTE